MKKIYTKMAPWGPAAFCLVIWGIFLWKRINYQLDSDMASDLMLGNILSKENGILSEQWMYSTELRVLNMQLFYKLIFLITNNWHVVRCISSVLLLVVLLICFYYMMCQLGEKKAFFWSAPLLIWNYSEIYYHFVSKVQYYIPHMSISFLTIGMILQYVKSVKRKQKKLLMFLMIILALFAGLGGPRQIIVLYLPILVAAVFCLALEIKNIKDKKQYVILCAVNFGFSVLGYFINSKILSKKYQFMIWDIHYKEFSIESVVASFNGILRTFGYSDGKIFSFATVLNGCMFIVVVMMAYSIYENIQRKKTRTYSGRLLSFYLFFAVLINILLYAFTDMPYADRYFLPIMIFAIPVTAITIGEIQCNLQVKKFISVFVLLMVYGCGVYKLHAWAKVDATVQIREVTGYLLDNNVVNGYATFWNGNIMTELSNGEVEVWVTSCTEDIFHRNDNIYKWLQVKDHIDRKPDGKIFVLLTQEEYAACPQELLSQEKPAFSNTNYILYIFNSYDEFEELLEEPT